MCKKWMRIWSMLLVVAMMANFLPAHAAAVDTTESTVIKQDVQDQIDVEDVYIVDEVVDRRTEYTKVFQLSNGLYIASVYTSPVHYEVNGQWAEIDNTLQLSQTRSGNAYVNTAGVWQVSFPQNMTETNGITITKDGYVFSFRMSGELHSTTSKSDQTHEPGIVEIPNDPLVADEITASDDMLPAEDVVKASGKVQEEAEVGTTSDGIQDEQKSDDGNDTMIQIAPKKEAIASIETVDMESVKNTIEYPETVAEKVSSRLSYAGVYENTDVIFDLRSNQVKESVFLKERRDTLKGYTYTLEVGTLRPVLLETGEIELRDADGKNIIMYMPAPYLIDSTGATCFDVKVSLTGTDGKYTLTYELPQKWLADAARQWPVILDPVVLADTDVNNVKDTSVYSKTYESYTRGILSLGNFTDRGLARTYIKYQNLPALTSADVIVNAQLFLFKPYGSGTASTIEVHQVTSDWASETITWTSQPTINPVVEDYVISQAAGPYYWDITEIARSWYDHTNYGLMLKYPNEEESVTTENWKQFYSSEGADYQHMPNALIIFRNNNGLEGYWDYTTSSAGRAGTGYVNQYSGNLIWTHSDIGFGGNRMPVAISHIYNANDSDKNEFGLGNGWRTNFNQRVYHWDATGSYGDYYVWEDADGTKHYFQYKSSNTYADEDGLELTLTIHGSGTSRYYLITDKYGNTSRFDNKGRLVKQENNQQTKSSITITYTTSNGWLISSITDGVGRKYEFEYDGLSLLARIICKGTDNAELSRVSYSYDLAPNLTKITHNDGLSTSYAYEVRIYQTSSAPVIANLLSSVTDVDGYVLTYNYHSTASYYEPSRVSTIKESQDSFLGGQLTFEYGQNQTTITDRYGNVQIFQFNNWGNTVAVYDDQGRAQFANYANDNPTSPNSTAPAAEGTEDDSDKKGNQLQAASKLQNTVSNLLQDSSFESSTNWIPNASSVSCAVTTETAYLGSKSLKLVRPSAGAQAGVYREAFSVLAGETYTFSAYVKTGSARAYLVLWDGSKQVSSEILPANSDWTRLEVSYARLYYVFEAGESDKFLEVIICDIYSNIFVNGIEVENNPVFYELIEPFLSEEDRDTLGF